MTFRYNLKIECAPEDTRDYLGVSSIGAKCERKIWYGINRREDATPFTARQRRTFAIGHKLESLLIGELVRNGYEIRDTNSRLSGDVDGFYGHCDGVIVLDGSPCILEIKTANKSSYNSFVKLGLKLWNYQYYSQVQMYMGFSGLDKAMMLVINKDDSNIENEMIDFDEHAFNSLNYKAKLLLEREIEPDRISETPMFYACKMCQFTRICHEKSSKAIPI